MRKSNASGFLHKEGITTLTKQIEEAFEHELGPGSLPPKNNKLLKGMLVPHDAYDLAGPAIAWSYFSLGKSDVYVIIGTNLSSTNSVIMQETTETPFGMVRVDQNLARELIEKGNLLEAPKDFEKDKKIDSQLPFIQYLNKEKLESIKILPVLLGPDSDIAEISADIKEVLADQNKSATFICVSNMTYYGSEFKYAPYVNNVRKNIYDTDAKVLELIKNNDVIGLKNFVEEKLIPILGIPAIELLMKLIGPAKVDLHQYYTSADINEIDNPSIAYASMTLC